MAALAVGRVILVASLEVGQVILVALQVGARQVQLLVVQVPRCKALQVVG